MDRCRAFIPLLLTLSLLPATGRARTVYECLRDDALSLSTVPEPGSRCKPKQVRSRKSEHPDFWGDLGPIRGPMYQRRVGGVMAYSTRGMPGWTEVQSVVSLRTPSDSSAHYGLGDVGKPRLDIYAAQFSAAAKRNGIEDAWLRAIAHAESGFNPMAVSPKGAQGVMQLMPAVAREYGVANPFSSNESIDAAARHIKALMRRYKGDLSLVAAAYNAGPGSVERFGGVPPYSETQAYVDKVQTLYALYRDALRKKRARS